MWNGVREVLDEQCGNAVSGWFWIETTNIAIGFEEYGQDWCANLQMPSLKG